MQNKKHKGIILAGGHATRLYPLAKTVSKHLLPVYDKPMIYYSLSVLMLAGVRNVLLICKESDEKSFKSLLSDGSQFGIQVQYRIQDNPDGVAQALSIGSDFIGDDPIWLILGDNIFYAHDLPHLLRQSFEQNAGSTIFIQKVKNPSDYGVVSLHDTGEVRSIEEKPDRPQSNWAVTGLYLFDSECVEVAKSLTPSARGELEITDVIRHYLSQRKLNVQKLGRGCAWLDTGTQEAFLDASTFMKAIEQRQGLKVGCLEEIAYAQKWIDEGQLQILINKSSGSYQKYLEDLL